MKNIACLFLILVALISKGQTIKDYFLPTEGKNKSNFYTPNPTTGERTDMRTTIWFIKKGDNFDVMQAKLTNGQPTSIITQRVSILDNEIKLLKTTSTNLFETNKQTIHSPPQILLRLPKSGQKSLWTIKTSDSSTKCTGELIRLDVGGESKKVLKVKKEVYEDGKLVDWATSFEYYVFGIGLWKIEIPTGEVIDKLDSQEFDGKAEKLK